MFLTVNIKQNHRFRTTSDNIKTQIKRTFRPVLHASTLFQKRSA